MRNRSWRDCDWLHEMAWATAACYPVDYTKETNGLVRGEGGHSFACDEARIFPVPRKAAGGVGASAGVVGRVADGAGAPGGGQLFGGFVAAWRGGRANAVRSMDDGVEGLEGYMRTE